MPTWTQDDSTTEIFTYKAGLLSRVAHDLLLRCTSFELTLEEDTVHGHFDASSLMVMGAMKDGVLNPSTLSDKDKRDVLDNVRKHVFKRHEQAKIHFECDELEVEEDHIEGEGRLTIPPRSHDIDFEVQISGGEAVCEVKLHQPDWGISPFTALMGALKIKPDILVRVTVPWKS